MASPKLNPNTAEVSGVDCHVNAAVRLGTVTIAAGQSLSGGVDLDTAQLAGLILPSGWTAANITFQGSVDDQNYFELYDDAGNEVTATVALTTGELMLIASPVKFRGVRFLKVRSGTAAAPVAQPSGATITVIAAPAI